LALIKRLPQKTQKGTKNRSVGFYPPIVFMIFFVSFVNFVVKKERINHEGHEEHEVTENQSRLPTPYSLIPYSLIPLM